MESDTPMPDTEQVQVYNLEQEVKSVAAITIATNGINFFMKHDLTDG